MGLLRAMLDELYPIFALFPPHEELVTPSTWNSIKSFNQSVLADRPALTAHAERDITDGEILTDLVISTSLDIHEMCMSFLPHSDVVVDGLRAEDSEVDVDAITRRNPHAPHAVLEVRVLSWVAGGEDGAIHRSNVSSTQCFMRVKMTFSTLVNL